VHNGREALPSAESYELAGQVTDPGLMPAEVDMLRFIASSSAYTEIARALGLSEEAVQGQVRSILSKLNVQDGTHAEMAAAERGLVQAERAARHAAEAANRAKTEFLANMSHELRAPLHAVLGYAQLLTMSGGLSARQERGLNTIHQSGEHLLSLINDILDLARIEAGRSELNPVPLPLRTFLQAALELMLVKAEEKRLALVFDAGTGLPMSVLADERRLRQVLLNLLGNAIKFTDHGTVTLRASAEPQGPSRVLLRLDVEDTGVGMRPDDMERIFEPFQQVGDVERRSGGTGLGLAITRALAIDMGGQVQVSSEVGRGTRFRVELPLPLASQVKASPRKVPRVARYQGAPRRVLVVDDVAANRTLLMCDFLTNAGFEVAEASDGSELVAAATRFRPDLVLIDSVMPSVDGLEATRRLRQDADLAAIPVIAVSASASAEHRAACLHAGVNVFLPKPVSLETLQAHIGEQLGLQWIEPTAGAD
jgi:signal transduction histidine kinase/ActR/RegA family two-component response regulator